MASVLITRVANIGVETIMKCGEKLNTFSNWGILDALASSEAELSKVWLCSSRCNFYSALLSDMSMTRCSQTL